MQRDSLEDELRRTMTAVSCDHERLRGELLDALQRGEHQKYASDYAVRFQKRLIGGFAALASCSLLAVGIWFLIVSTRPRTTYAFEELRERILSARSLHVVGRIYHAVNVDGTATRREFPTESYMDRSGRLWRKEYGFSPERVETVISAEANGSRWMFMESNRTGVVFDAVPLATELHIESELQVWAQNLFDGFIRDYEKMGKEVVDSKQSTKYSLMRQDGSSATRHVIWVDDETSFPMKSAWYNVSDDGTEELTMIYDRILVNTPPPKKMFPVTVPEGYEVNRGIVPPIDQFSIGSAGNGRDTFTVLMPIVVEDLGVLVCWSQQKQPVDLAGEPPKLEDLAAGEIAFQLVLGNKKREGVWRPIAEQSDGKNLWKWGVVLPRDREPVRLGEQIVMTMNLPKLIAEISQQPLRFDDQRLAKVIERLQTEAFPELPDDGPFTLADFRKIVGADDKPSEGERRLKTPKK